MTSRSLRHPLVPALLAAASLAAPAWAGFADDTCTASASPAVVAPAAFGDDIVTVAANAGSFETLLAAAKAAGLAGALQGEGPFTVFAPTDEAFGKLPKGTVQALLDEPGRGTLTAILKRHVVAREAIEARDLVGRRAVRTLGGARIDVALGANGLTVGGRRVVATDVSASNGVIHVVDAVILPPADDIPTLATKAGAFNTLLAAVQAAGLVETLQGGPFTVLAPTDDAFGAIPSDTIATLLRPENREVLTSVLALHVLPGRVYAEDALGGASIKSLNGQSVRLRFEDGGLRANDARVLNADLEASNGLVHVIDAVLLPEGFTVPATGNLVIGIYSEAPKRSVRDLLGLRSGQGLAIDSFAGNSAAKAAGLQAGDILLAVGDAFLTSESLAAAKRTAGAGGTLKVLVLREIEIEVRVEDH